MAGITINGMIPIDYEGITIRRFTMRDAGRFYYMTRDENMVKYMECGVNDWEGTLKYLGDIIKRYDTGEVNRYGIAIDGGLVGGISVYVQTCGKAAEIGYWVGRDYWGEGIATRALKAVVDLLEDVEILEKVFLYIHGHNMASEAVANKVGFKKVGRAEGNLMRLERKLRVTENSLG